MHNATARGRFAYSAASDNTTDVSVATSDGQNVNQAKSKTPQYALSINGGSVLSR